MRQLILAGGAIAVGLLVTGCSDPTSRAVYDGAQSERDRLPDHVLSEGNDDIYDLDSSRFLGGWEDHDFYAVRTTGGDDCVAVIGQDPGDWSVSCSTGGRLGFGGGGVRGEFAPDGFPESSLEAGWVSVHPSLRVEK